MMSSTGEMYNALLQEIQERTLAPNKIISKKYTCTNGIGLIYSISSGLRMRALAITADKK